MDTHVPTRAEAWDLLNRHNTNDGLIRHALSVEAVMRHMARKLGEDGEMWGIVGLVHDLDYEQFPDQHCRKSPELLAAAGWPAEYIHAVVSHGWGLCSEVEPTHVMEKVLYAVDELTGLVKAAALMRPSRSVLDMEPPSVKKKWKDRKFAAGVNREVIEKGAAMLGVDLDGLIADTILGMRSAAKEIGLEGNPGAGAAGAPAPAH
ncbi:MAG: HDIG domain-containing protein [Spirochaetes bacterium]|nr:HDIG domain-containing protein [Spirochaetota bacterium]